MSNDSIGMLLHIHSIYMNIEPNVPGGYLKIILTSGLYFKCYRIKPELFEVEIYSIIKDFVKYYKEKEKEDLGCVIT